ncbi:MAG TPA: hypothetical protein VLL76_05610 [Candidatus Omnitrophota bacterium]|nr:hypothetical protein [Candidatus Omnitrophota bacterium]
MTAHFLLVLLFAALAVVVGRRRPWLGGLMLLVALTALVGLWLAPS